MPARETIAIAPGWESLLRAGGLDSVTKVYQCTQGEVVVRSGSSEVRRIQLGNGAANRTVFIKKYWANRFGQLWSGALRGAFFGRSKVRREFQNLARLREWGLDAPVPVAYGEERSCRWLTRSFLISEGVPDPIGLDVLIRDHLAQESAALPTTFRRELVERLADHVRRLHAHRFVHHDLFWRNIILSGRSRDHFYLIDAHKGRVWLPGTGVRARVKDLATLEAAAPSYFRRTERLRFLLRYLGNRRLDATGRRIARQILSAAEPLRAKQLRRVREGRVVQA